MRKRANWRLSVHIKSEKHVNQYEYVYESNPQMATKNLATVFCDIYGYAVNHFHEPASECIVSRHVLVILSWVAAFTVLYILLKVLFRVNLSR